MIGLTSVLLFASLAGPPALEWQAPEGCPTADDVHRSLGALASHADLDQVRARGTIRKVGAQYELRLEVQTGRLRQRRSLRADTCGTLGEAAALLIAISVDPLEVAAQLTIEPRATNPRAIAPDAVQAVVAREYAPSPPESRLPPAPTPPASTPPAPAPAVSKPAPEPPAPTPPARPSKAPSARAPARDVRLFVRAEGAIDAFSARSETGAAPTGVAGGALGLLLPRLRLEVHGLYGVPRPLEYGNRRYGTLGHWALGARVCGRVVRSVLEVPLCAGLEGRRYLTDPGIEPRDTGPSWLTVLVGLGVVWSPHPRVGIGARTEFLIAPYRTDFHPRADGDVVTLPVHRTELLNLRFAVGVEVRFGPGVRRDGKAASRPPSKVMPR